jgi:DNA repair protein RadC
MSLQRSLPNAESDDEVVLRALRILRARFKERDVFSKPEAVRNYLRLQGQGLEHEVFAVMYLDTHNRPFNTNACSEGV